MDIAQSCDSAGVVKCHIDLLCSSSELINLSTKPKSWIRKNERKKKLPQGKIYK